MRRHRRLIVAASLSVLGVLVAASAVGGIGWRAHWFGDHGPAYSGPIEAGSRSGWSLPVSVGTRFAEGFQVLALNGHEPAVITSVTVDGGSPGLKVLGFLIADPTRQHGEDAEYKGWPPVDSSLGNSTHPAIGATILPINQTKYRLGYELLVGYERKTAQLASRRAIIVGYRVGDEDYEVRLPSRFVACPPTMSGRQCGSAANRSFPSG